MPTAQDCCHRPRWGAQNELQYFLALGPAIKYWAWIYWTKSILKVVEIPCSFRIEGSHGQPETLSCSERSLEVVKAYGCLGRGKGSFTSAYGEKKWKDHLKDSFTCLWQVRSEILLNSSKQKTAVVIQQHIIGPSASQKVMFSRYLRI